MPTYEVTVEMIVPARQTVKVNAHNEADALSQAQRSFSPAAADIGTDPKTWSLRSTKVKKVSSVIVRVADE
jgi:hypothetical protein